MKKSLPNNHFDDLVRDRYEKHTIPPEKEMWENINSRVNQKKLNEYLRRIQRLRIAAAILAFALIGSIILYEIDSNKQDDPITDLYKPENPAIDLVKPGLPADTIPKKPFNSVRKVVLSDEEQDIPETDGYPNNDDSAVILSK